jgi:deazaflavin-dependent oxidoreductase (nitroreductase family)
MPETLSGTYVPSTLEWVRDQVKTYERTGGQEANTLLDTGIPVIIVTMRGAKTGEVRKIALVRVEHGGEYALVASFGGAPKHPAWYWNLTAHPDEVLIQDGPEPFRVSVREVEGDERAEWWDRAIAVYPPYAEYQENTDRVLPVLVATPA